MNIKTMLAALRGVTAYKDVLSQPVMERALRLFGAMENRVLVLGAYGCGVFRNDPREVALWWTQLLALPEYSGRFAGVTHAVLDRSKDRKCWRAFAAAWGEGGEDCGQK